MTGGRRGGVPALVVVTVLWGVSFPLVGGVVGKDPSENEFVFLAWRFAFALAGFLPLAAIVARQSSGRGLLPWALGALVGVLLFLGYWTQTVGLKYTTASRSAFITMLSVPMVPLIAAAMHRRRPSKAHVLGSLAALAGVGLVLAPQGSFRPNVGDWWTLACAVVFAVEIQALASIARRVPSPLLTVAMIGAVTACSFLGLAVAPGGPPTMDGNFWIAVLVTGFVCTTLAIGGMTWAQARISAELAAIVFALEPVFAGVFEYLWLGRGMNALQWAGGAVVVAAVAWTARAPEPGNESAFEVGRV